MSFETLLYSVADRVATITVDRPEVFNAINLKLADEFDAAMDQFY